MKQFEKNHRDAYLREYANEHAIGRYITDTAGKGIQYLLAEVYGPLYSRIIDSIRLGGRANRGFRLLEYGCGAGMNLIYIVRLLGSKGIPIDAAVGTDFSKALLKAAEHEKERFIRSEDHKKLTFLEASNESLLEDLTRGLGQLESPLHNCFDLIVGVNTFRYAVRLNKQNDCADDIASLLAPGGYSIMIDMNNRFPLFKSRFSLFNREPKEQTWLPSLEEYTAPFRLANLNILESRHFCWIPHSANSFTLVAAKLFTPLLNSFIPSFAMRSLVVARKEGVSR